MIIYMVCLYFLSACPSYHAFYNLDAANGFADDMVYKWGAANRVSLERYIT